MDKTLYAFLMVLLMAVVTYLIRVIPMVVFKKKIKSEFLSSFLYYVPYTVLSAMTFPFIIYSSGHVISAVIGSIVALIGAFTKRSLIVVAILASVSVFVCEIIMLLI